MKHIKKSLQTLKDDLSHQETLIKTIHNRYPHLSSLSQEKLLTYFQFTTLDELEEYIQNSIDTSSDNNTDEQAHCSCKDSAGEFKEHYKTYQVAQKQADWSMMQHKVLLKVYPCPYGYGWHLTKG